MASKKLIILILLPSLCRADLDGLFGIELSKPYPKEAVSSQPIPQNRPVIRFSVPVPEDNEIKQFHDVAVQLSLITNNVSGIIADRAYKTANECLVEKRNIESILNKVFPINNDKDTKDKWHYLSKDGERVANLGCSVGIGDRYHTLRLTLHDIPEDNKIIEFYSR